ncbi:unnamed protein product [Dovyalis caffra]|uniref:Uncharacterized protein n=1 Tax=Dovyalis caffra TaxID=77055 RepID=A0AAV1R320_9ROSI|nr:unnamed protein product [Dovyalis caffra]
MTDRRCRVNIRSVLFSKINEAVPDCTGAADVDILCSCTGIVAQDNCDQGKRPDLLSSNVGSVADWSSNKSKIDESNHTLITERLWEIFKILTSDNHGGDKSILPEILKNDTTVKRDIERSIHLLSTAIEGCSQKSPPDDENKSLFEEADSMLDDLRRLYVAMEMSKLGLQNDISTLLKKLQSRKPRIEPLLNRIFLPEDENLKMVASELYLQEDKNLKRVASELSLPQDENLKMISSQLSLPENENLKRVASELSLQQDENLKRVALELFFRQDENLKMVSEDENLKRVASE